MKNLILASSNEHKIKEINQMMPNIGYKVISMKDAGCTDDIVEDGDTLEANAMIKARYLYEKLGGDVFSEDTGLEIDALNGAPGVVTARYAGPQRNNDDNMKLVLEKLYNNENRTAQFRTVICMILDDEEYLFEGKVRGAISLGEKGVKGFGYDPIFKPDGYDQTFGELGDEVKNTISHRKRALEAMVNFLVEKANL